MSVKTDSISIPEKSVEVSNLESRSSIKIETKSSVINSNVIEPIGEMVEEKLEINVQSTKPNYLKTITDQWLEKGKLGS